MEEQTVKQEVESSTISTEAQQGVTAESPTANEQGVQAEESPTSEQPNVAIPTSPPSTDEGKILYDEEGVPLQNRALQYKRMLEKTQQQQEEVLKRLETIQTSNQQQQPQYTVEELEAFSERTDNDEHRRWAHKEIRKLEKEQIAGVVKETLEGYQTKQFTEQKKQVTLNEVMRRYPDAFIKNPAGQTVGWNTQSALTQKIGQYMQHPDISNNPEGLMVAAALAYSDISIANGFKTKQETQKLQNEVKSLQRKTLVDSGVPGDTVVKSSRQAAIEKSRTGRPVDAVEAMKELWKATGRLQ